MSYILCDQCSIHLRCNTAEENCPKKCSSACFSLGFKHFQTFNWFAFEPLLRPIATLDVSDDRIVAETFSWADRSNSSAMIGTVVENSF